MNLGKIKQLLDKYESGKTSTAEETLLKDFFLREKVPIHLLKYKEIFNFIDISQKEELPDSDFDEKILRAIGDDKVIPMVSGNRRKIYSLISIAASIIILIGLYFQFGKNHSNYNDTYDNPQLAYNEVKKTLLLVSGNLNSGVDELKDISAFNNGLKELNNISTFETGMKNLEKISVLHETKENIISK